MTETQAHGGQIFGVQTFQEGGDLTSNSSPKVRMLPLSQGIHIYAQFLSDRAT